MGHVLVKEDLELGIEMSVLGNLVFNDLCVLVCVFLRFLFLIRYH